jgi:DNA-directed RNA polymerase specialized sigma24 family protein
MSRNFMEDQHLADLLFHNNTEAFEEIYQRHWFSLYKYALKKLKCTEKAKITVQDVFVRLWDKRNTLPVNFSLSLFLYDQVRKSVIKQLEDKLKDLQEQNWAETFIIPGFRASELAKAKQPVRRLKPAGASKTKTNSKEVLIFTSKTNDQQTRFLSLSGMKWMIKTLFTSVQFNYSEKSSR